MDDNTPMPFGKYKGTKLIEVPAKYLIWLYDNHLSYDPDSELKQYIIDNMQSLNKEIEDEKRNY